MVATGELDGLVVANHELAHYARPALLATTTFAAENASGPCGHEATHG